MLVSDASFPCQALQVDRWTAARVPTYGYQFNDDNAPLNMVPPEVQLQLPHLSTHGTELPYLFDQPNAPFPAMLTNDQQALAASMRTAWANFAASGNPSSRTLPWPWIGNRTKVLSFVPCAVASTDRLRRRAPLLVLGRRMTRRPHDTQAIPLHRRGDPHTQA